MRLLIFILALIHLAVAKCPSFFEGLDASSTLIERFDEAVDTACGRMNYTSIFWSRSFYEQLANQTASNSSDGQSLASFKSFFTHLKEKISALDRKDATEGEIDAKHYFDTIFSKHRQILELERLVEETKSRPDFEEKSRNFGDIFWANPLLYWQRGAQIMNTFAMPTNLPPGLSVAAMHTVKDGFGVVETDEIRQSNIDTALSAIERVGLNNRNEKLGELFERLYVLVTDEVGTPNSPFNQFAVWAEHIWQSPEIGPLEILPAVEQLYVQYRSLKINESRIFADWMLMSNVIFPPINQTEEEAFLCKMRALHDHRQIDNLLLLDKVISHEDVIKKLTIEREERKDEFDRICPSEKDVQCFKDFPEEARKEIIAAFPELFVYLKRRKVVRMDLLALTTRAHRATIGKASLVNEHAEKFNKLDMKHLQTSTPAITDVEQPLTIEAYAAIVIGILILLLFVAGLICCFCSKNKDGRTAASAAPAAGLPELKLPMINKADVLRQ